MIGRTARNNVAEALRTIYLMGTMFLAGVTVPIYLVHSRGWAGAARSTLRFVGYLLLSVIVWLGVVGILAVFGIHQADSGVSFL